MRILLDVDGPLADWTTAFLDTVRCLFGFSHTREEVDTYDIVGWVTARHPSISVRDLYEAISAPGWVYGIPPIESAIAVVRELLERHEVYFVTSPTSGCQTWGYERTNWLWRHLRAPRDRVVITSAKHLVEGDLFVDDKPENVRAWQAAHPRARALLLDTHHNRTGHDDLPRITRLADVVAYL